MRQGRQYLLSDVRIEKKNTETIKAWKIKCFEILYVLKNAHWVHLGNVIMHEIFLLFIDEFYLTLDASSGFSFQDTDFCIMSWACYF